MKNYICLIIGFLIVISCDENNRDDFEKIDSYPTSIGSEWLYESKSILKIYESEISNKIIDADTIVFLIHVRIEKDTILNDTMNVIQFTSRIEEFDLISKQYFFVDTDGLKAYAYSNPSSHVFAKKRANKRIPSDSYLFNISDSPPSGNDNIVVYGPKPRLNLKLPLELNSKWTYTTPVEPMNLQIDKEIIGFENVKIENINFSCYKISWIYLENKFFDGTKIHDWVSEKGLIKRQIIHERAALVVEENGPFGSSQFTETITLKNLVIK